MAKVNFKTLNKFQAVDWNIDTEKHEYKKLGELFTANERRFVLRGVYTSKKGKFGETPYAITDKYIITLPKSQLESVKAIRDDDDMVTAVKKGECSIAIHEYYSTQYDKTCYDITFENTESN